MTRRIRQTLVWPLAVALLGLSPIGEAQTTWYTIEIIVFQHLSNDGLYTEHWPADPGRPAIEDAITLTIDTGEGSAEAFDPKAFHLLGSSEFQLGEAAGRLKRSGGYCPLLHVAWRQPGYTRSEARKVHIHTDLPNRFRDTDGLGISLNHVIEGTLRLSRARYLHLEADLLHHRQVPLDTATEGTMFRMQDSRRMRSKEVHYIDHPLVGLLVLVTPYEPLEEELEAEEVSQNPDTSN